MIEFRPHEISNHGVLIQPAVHLKIQQVFM